jgi:hypothetical protein
MGVTLRWVFRILRDEGNHAMKHTPKISHRALPVMAFHKTLQGLPPRCCGAPNGIDSGLLDAEEASFLWYDFLIGSVKFQIILIYGFNAMKHFSKISH